MSSWRIRWPKFPSVANFLWPRPDERHSDEGNRNNNGLPNSVDRQESPDLSKPTVNPPNSNSGQPKNKHGNNKETPQDPALNQSASIAKLNTNDMHSIAEIEKSDSTDTNVASGKAESSTLKINHTNSDVPAEHQGVENRGVDDEPKAEELTTQIENMIVMISEKYNANIKSHDSLCEKLQDDMSTQDNSCSLCKIEISMEDTGKLLEVLKECYAFVEKHHHRPELYPTTEFSETIVNVKVIDPAPSRATKKFIKALKFALEPKKIHLSTDEAILTNEILPGSNLVLVVCNNHSRLEEDVKNSLLAIRENLLDRILLVVVHCKRKGKLSNVSSKEKLEGKFGKIPEVVDIAFDETIYNCEMNTTALEMITRLKGRLDCKNTINNNDQAQKDILNN